MSTRQGFPAGGAGARTRFGLLISAWGFLLVLSGCSSEGGISGRATFSGARVCLDTNASLTCDPDEPGDITDGEGRFRLPENGSDTADSILLLQVEEGDVNLLEGRPAEKTFLLLNPDPGGKNITVWSTLAWSRILGGTAAGPEEGEEQVREAFGLSAAIEEPGERESALAQLALGVYVQQYGLTAGAGKAEMVRAAAETTYAAASRLNRLLDWYRQAAEIPPPANAGSHTDNVFLADYDRIPLFANPATYGIGLDESNLDLKGNCLVPGFIAVPGLCENTGDYVFELVNNINDVLTHFQVGAVATAGISVGSFDIVSVSGGFSYLKNTVMRDDRLYIAIRHEEILCGYPISADLAPNYADLFASDYQDFRNLCGDRYLVSVTTGGYFYGLIEIALDEDQDIEQERLSLSGKVLGIKVFDKTWTHTAAEIAKDYRTSTQVVSNFFDYATSLTMPAVIEKYNEFLAIIKSNSCQGPAANVTCGYLASFASYATATNRAVAPDPVLSTYLPNMHSYETFYFEAEDILAELADIITHPDNYNIGKNVDELHESNDWSRNLLIEVQSGLQEKRNLALSRWSDCWQDIYHCTPGAASINFSDNPTRPTWLDLKLDLPEKKFFFPGDCRELADILGLTEDEGYDLYFGGREEATFTADCVYMATSQPRTYLVLENTSTGPDQPSYNQVWIATGSNSGVGKIFTRLEVTSMEPVTGSVYLEVIGPQEDFIQTSPAAAGTMLELLKSAPVLSARASNSGSAGANLNLEGTSLHLISDPVFELRGNLKGFRYRVEISSDRKNVDLLLEPVPGAAAGSVTEAVVRPVSPIRLEHD